MLLVELPHPIVSQHPKILKYQRGTGAASIFELGKSYQDSKVKHSSFFFHLLREGW